MSLRPIEHQDVNNTIELDVPFWALFQLAHWLHYNETIGCSSPDRYIFRFKTQIDKLLEAHAAANILGAIEFMDETIDEVFDLLKKTDEIVSITRLVEPFTAAYPAGSTVRQLAID